MLKPDAFARVFSKGVRSSDRFFTFLATPNDGSTPRLGLAVSRKVSASAVGRNRIKRQVRDSFRLNQAALPAIDIVAMAKRDAAGADNAELRLSIEKHWRILARKCDAS